jgi:hypothetical protein
MIMRLFFSVMLAFLPVLLLAEGPGVRGAFTRGGFVGAEYIAMGGAAEAVADDVFAIYWNPAGLMNLRNRKHVSADEIRRKAEAGRIDSITEADLARMDDTTAKGFFHIGVSASNLAEDRRAGFAGAAAPFFSGVIGTGLYSINSPDIQKRDETGAANGLADYTAGCAYLTYAFNADVTSFGISIKGLGENIDGEMYYGNAVDVGVRAEVFPLLRLGFVIQDIGLGFYSGSPENKKYDYGMPVFRGGVSLSTRNSDIILAASVVRKVDRDGFEYNIGVEYSPISALSGMIGLKDNRFAGGARVSIASTIEFSYALSYDPIDMAFNNTVSLAALF